MSREVLLGMLSQGNTGDEILAILDAISEDVNNTQEEEIQFYCDTLGGSAWHIVPHMLDWQYCEFDSDWASYVLPSGGRSGV